MDIHLFAAVLSTIAWTTSRGASDDRGTAEGKIDWRVAALVPARSGSKGIKLKNLARLGGETLLCRTVRVIRESGHFDSIWVSTDGDEIAREADSCGARVHWRDPATATDSAATITAVKDFLRFHPDVDAVAVVQCTSPFLKAAFLADAYRQMVNRSLDCVFSATRVHQLRWTDSRGGFVTPLNFNPMKRPRRQDWNGELIENGMFYLTKARLVTEEDALQNDRCGVIQVPKHLVLEIDTERDLALARAVYQLIDEERP